MTHWHQERNERVERPEVDAFIEEVIALGRASGFSISHEDCHGAFVIVPFSEDAANWLWDAHISEKE